MTAIKLLSDADACVAPGTGIATTWTLIGAETTYTGNLTTTDGYKIMASFDWVDVTSYTTNIGGEALGTDKSFMGTCVELLDSGTTILQTATGYGNQTICHWFYVNDGVSSGVGWASTGKADWGESRYMTMSQWGVAGSGVIGEVVTKNGTPISQAHGMVLNPIILPTTVFTPGVYTMTWYQPSYSSSYAATTLRRYNGGSADGD